MTIPPPASDRHPATPAVPPRPRLAAAVAGPTAEPQAVEAVHRAAMRAAHELFGARAVEVESFFDEGSSRLVYRVADRFTGEVLVETPPEELLRFYASSRRASEAGEAARPLLAVET